MKRIGFLSLAFLLAASAAFGQSAVRDGQSDYMPGKSAYTGADTNFVRVILAQPGAVHDDANSVWRWIRGDASGNLLMSESYPDRETYRTGSTAIISGTYATAAMDSTPAPIDVHNYKRLSLIIESPAAGAVRIAVQPRYHIGAATDTASWFPWVQTGFIAAGAAIVTMGDSTITASAFGTATAPGGDEFLCAMGRSNSSNATIAGRYMKRIYPLVTPGEPFFFDRISVRIRLLGGPSATATPINVYLVGSAN